MDTWLIAILSPLIVYLVIGFILAVYLGGWVFIGGWKLNLREILLFFLVVVLWWLVAYMLIKLAGKLPGDPEAPDNQPAQTA